MHLYLKGNDQVMRSKCGTAALAFLMAVILCATFVLSGCTGFFGARVDTEGTDPYQTPNVRGVWNAGSINKKITPYFDDVIASLKLANSNESNELVGKMRYSVDTVEGKNVLRSWIEGTQGQKIMLPDIVLDAGSCAVADHVPDAVADYDILKHAMTVASYGVNVDIYNMDATVTASQMANALVCWYESKTGNTVDTSSVTASVSDEYSKKLLALIPDYKYADKLIYDSNVTTTIFVDTLAVLMSEVNYEVYGVGSGNVTLMDFVRYAELFLRMYTPAGINYNYSADSESEDSSDNNDADVSDEEVKLETDWLNRVSDINFFNSIDSVLAQSEEPVTRLDLADNMLLMFKAGYDTDVEAQIAIADTSAESAKIMIDYAVMPNFPENSNLFSPDYKVKGHELPSLVSSFTEHCFVSWNNEGTYHYYDNLTMNIICRAFADLESFYTAQSYYPSEEAPEKVNNGAASDWFLTSLDTGDYAEKNVTVAASAMALHWSGNSSHSVTSLRNAYLSESDDEWDNDFIVSVLEDNNVSAAIYEDISTDAVLDELRAGNIILARYSDTGTKAVQCMIIYGFEKNVNSVKFTVNDPCVKHSQPTYANGSVPGKAEVIESELALWLIGKADTDYIVIYATGNGPASAGDISATDQ